MTGSMIEVLSRRLVWLPTVKNQLVNAGTTVGVGGGPKVLDGSQLVLKVHLFAISFGSLRRDVDVFRFEYFSCYNLLPFRCTRIGWQSESDRLASL